MKLMMNAKMDCRYTIAADEIVRACKENEWYTCGDMIEYAEMLAEYDARPLTADEFKELAIDICIHSEDEDLDDLQMLSHVMNVLEKYTVQLWHVDRRR